MSTSSGSGSGFRLGEVVVEVGWSPGAGAIVMG